MQKMIRVIMAGLAITGASCTTNTQNRQTSGKYPIDTVGENNFTDWHSQSNAQKTHPSHLSLNISVDFNQHKIEGSATWTIHPDKGTQYAVFDTRQMTIDSVLYADGTKAEFTMGAEDSILGSALKITIKPQTNQLKIFYKTGKNAAALQWLKPDQTFGKEKPFLYTQSESIYARTWVPCADGPGYRFTYDATVKVPKGLLALMSAKNPQKVQKSGIYHFEMKQSIPSYLLALSVGDIEFKAIDHRTGVYAEPAILKKSYNELDSIGVMLDTAEAMLGPYRWGRYDVLILPSGFPMGGMENPRLTFATPTMLAGDKSLIPLIAHEMAHSWTGNLVTNATWDDFWLNEGFTDYLTRRIMGALRGEDYAAMLWNLGARIFKQDVELLGKNNPDTRLAIELKGRDPDIGFTEIPYQKGAAFLLLVEKTVGRTKFDTFLRKYINEHAFQAMTTKRFLNFLNKNLLEGHPEWKKKIKVHEWVYEPGIPDNMPHVPNPRFDQVDTQIKAFLKGTSAKDLKTKGWSAYEWLRFLSHLPDNLSLKQMTDLDNTFDLTHSGNDEIIDLWFLHAIQSNYTKAYPEMKQFLYVTGREKFLEPLYRAMMKTKKGQKMAHEIFKKARPNYHPLAQKDIEGILDKE